MPQEQYKELTWKEEQEAQQKIAEILEIDESEIEYKELIFNAEKKVFKCFFVKTKKIIKMPNFINLSSYPLVFENCVFDSFDCVPSSEIPKILSFRNCTIKEFRAQGVKFKSFFEMQDCKIEKINIYGNSIFEDSVNFKGTMFKDDSLEYKNDLKILFYYVEFKKNVYFNKACFEIKFNPSNIIFHQEVNFNFAHFLGDFLFIRTEFKDKVDFSNTKFEKKCNLVQIDFKEDVKFYKAQFKDYVAFEEVKLLNDVDFSYASFYSAYFVKTKFRTNVNFYQAIFKKIPNFSQTIFEKSLNLVNVKLDFDFKDTQDRIKEEYNNYKESHTDSQKEKSLENFANDFRDSFRILKNASIKENNLLDASNFHRVELYCKEIELENKQEKSLKDKVDKWVLKLYRILCDHHTDLIQNLKWLVWLIALYSMLIGRVCAVYPIALLGILINVFGCKKRIFISQITSLIIILYVIFQKPKIIFGVAELFSNNLNWWQNFITAVYTILIALVLFSLHKTARKNSIVPS